MTNLHVFLAAMGAVCLVFMIGDWILWKELCGTEKALEKSERWGTERSVEAAKYQVQLGKAGEDLEKEKAMFKEFVDRLKIENERLAKFKNSIRESLDAIDFPIRSTPFRDRLE